MGKHKASKHNVILGKLLKSAALKGAAQEVIRDTFSRAHALAGQVHRGEITMKRATADLLSGLVVKVGRESLKALPTVLAGGSHTKKHRRELGQTAPRGRPRAKKTAAKVKASVKATPPVPPEPPGGGGGRPPRPLDADHILWRAELQLRHQGRTKRF